MRNKLWLFLSKHPATCAVVGLVALCFAKTSLMAVVSAALIVTGILAAIYALKTRTFSNGFVLKHSLSLGILFLLRLFFYNFKKF